MDQPNSRVIKDSKIDIRVPQITRDQADKLASLKHLSLSTWLQLLIDQEYKRITNTQA